MLQQLCPQTPPVIKTVAKAGQSSIRGVGIEDAGSAAFTTTVAAKDTLVLLAQPLDILTRASAEM